MIEDDIKLEFEKSIRAFFKENDAHRDATAIHISTMVYNCARLLWYHQRTAETNDRGFDTESLYRVWIGTKLHETPITPKHEINLIMDRRGYRVSGTIDEIFNIDGNIILADKKFVGRLPSAMNDHHRNQVMFYSVMLNDLRNVKVDMVALIYFSPVVDYYNKQRMSVFVNSVTTETLDEYRKKFLGLLDATIDGLINDTLPAKNTSWYCRYCPFKPSCDAGMKEVAQLGQEMTNGSAVVNK